MWFDVLIAKLLHLRWLSDFMVMKSYHPKFFLSTNGVYKPINYKNQ